MTIDVLCFGILKDLVGSARESMQVAEYACVGDVVASIRSRCVADEAIWATMAVAVNREYAGLATVLHEGDEVALLPPVSGGME